MGTGGNFSMSNMAFGGKKNNKRLFHICHVQGFEDRIPDPVKFAAQEKRHEHIIGDGLMCSLLQVYIKGCYSIRKGANDPS